MIRKNKIIAKIMVLALCANTLNCIDVFGVNTSMVNENVIAAAGKVEDDELDTKDSFDLEKINNTTTGAGVDIDYEETDAKYFSFDESTGTIIRYKEMASTDKVVVPKEINGVRVRVIGENAFNNLKISELILPEGIETIGDSAFVCCENLQKVQLPESIKEIGRQAFRGTNIKTIVVPAEVHEIRQQTFADCVNLENVEILGDIDEVGYKAFAGDRNLKMINIFGNMRLVGSDAFTDTNSMFKVYAANNDVQDALIHVGVNDTQILPLDESSILSKEDCVIVYPVREGDFEFCKLNGEIVNYVGDRDAENIVVPEEIDGVKVQSIGENAFSGCKVKKIELPETLKEIGKFAFLECRDLEEIKLPESLRRIGIGAFQESGLRNIVIPQKVKRIAENTFLGCSQLEIVEIEGDIDCIECCAFVGNSNLKSINISGSLDCICENAISSCNFTFKVYVGSEQVKKLLLMNGVTENQIIVNKTENN